MTTITIKINERSKVGKTFQDLIELFSKQLGIEIIEEKSHYNTDFVKKIKRAEKEKSRTMLDAKSLRESIK